MNLSDRAVSYLRTVVPVLWGSLLGLALPSIPWLPVAVAEWLRGELAVSVVTAAAIALWYVLWRKVEAHIPDWLTRVVLGSAQTPTYNVVPLGTAAIAAAIADTERQADEDAAAGGPVAEPYTQPRRA